MIHLINMPFSDIMYPNLALEQIKAQLHQASLEASTFYLNFDLAKSIGFTKYHKICLSNVQIGEWLFAGQAFEKQPAYPDIEDFFELHNSETIRGKEKETAVIHLRKIRNNVIPLFLENCLRKLEALTPISVVGFSCSFFQTLSSISLGRLIKEKYPKVKIVYGGSGFHDQTGKELIEKIPWIDAVSTGEADDIIAPLFQALSNGLPPSGLQGVLYREANGNVQMGKPAKPVDAKTFRSLPDPDFTAYFQAVDQAGLLNDAGWRSKAVIPFESSRGCWWGQKKQCAFCGLNGHGMTYRTKDADQVYKTLEKFNQKYPIKSYYAVDNILPMSAFHSLIPRLKDKFVKKRTNIYYAVKSNLNREQLRALSESGITCVGPGIESLSTHHLKLMRKGVTALQNVFFLKCCREYGMHTRWNHLFRIPGETLPNYSQIESWIPMLHHFSPPYGIGNIQCFRFSPYYTEQGKWTENVRPEPWHEALYPADVFDLSRIAYCFKADWKNVLDAAAYKGAIEKMQEWRKQWTTKPVPPELTIHKLANNGIRIEDTRSGRQKAWHFDSAEALVYDTIKDTSSLAKIMSICKQKTAGMSESFVKDTLAKLTDNGFALEENGRYLGLAIPAQHQQKKGADVLFKPGKYLKF